MLTALLNADTFEKAHVAYLLLSPEDRDRLSSLVRSIENPEVRIRLRNNISLARAMERLANAPKDLPPGTVI